MKTKLFLLLIALQVSCSHTTVSSDPVPKAKRSFEIQRKYASSVQPRVDYDAYYNDLEKFNSVIENNYKWREDAVEFYKSLSETEIFSNEQIVTIHEHGTATYLTLRDELFIYIEGIHWLTNPSNKLEVNTNKPTTIVQKTRKIEIANGKSTRVINYQDVSINPYDEDGKILVRQIKMGLAAALALYDNYIIVISQFAEFDKVRHLINYDNAQYKYGISSVTKSFNKISNYKRISKAIKLFKDLETKTTNTKSNITSQEDDPIIGYIHNSHSFKELEKQSKRKIFKNKLEFISNFFTDYFKEAGNNIMNQISKGFGNTVGLVQSRNGKLFDLKDNELNKISSKLKPLDILLEKTPFRLTDKFIPGHWGHVAIWTGTKDELIAHDLWDHPVIKPHQNAIEFENKRIIEALRPGVQINTLKHFMNIDDLAVVRMNNLNEENTEKYLINSFKQLGKKYDFNFDVETDEKIVCSELAYVTFNDIEWNTSKAVGRYTISPDNVGEKVTPNGEFAPVILFHDGVEVKENLFENFQSLLKTSSLK